MKKIYFQHLLILVCGLFASLIIASCKKDPKQQQGPPAAKPFGQIGLYELDSSVYRRIFIAISAVGTAPTTQYLVFDTGSTGMAIDATGLIPGSMITSKGITIPNGDSVVSNGITVT